MAIPLETIPFLQAEGHSAVLVDLADFDDDDFKQLAASICQPPDTEPDPANAG